MPAKRNRCSRAMKIVGVGQINFWDGGSLWIGRGAAGTSMHSHHAIQVSLVLKGVLRLRHGGAASWTEHRAAIVPSHVPHAFDASGQVVATIFCEPESMTGRALTARFGTERIVELPPEEGAAACRELALCYSSAAADDQLNEASVGVLQRLSRHDREVTATDARILRAIAFAVAHLAVPLRLADVAAAACLSPSRFRHLFVAETGLPLRRYLLWRRLQRALEVAVGGGSWVDAAHAANFADSAHLTRTFRRMLGMAPSEFRSQREAGPLFLAEDAGHRATVARG